MTAPGNGVTPVARAVPAVVPVKVRDSDLRPVVPGWLRTQEARRAMLRWWRIVTWHRVRFHGLRIPVYVPRLSWHALRGVLVALVWLARWSVDARSDALEQQLASGVKADAEEFRKLREARSTRIKARLSVVVGVALAAVGAGVLAWRYAPGQVWALAGLGVLVGLVRVGTPAGRPVLAPAMLASTGYRVLTDAIVMRALRAAGLGGQVARYDRDGNELAEDTRPTMAAPIARSANGRGYEVLVDLPYGRTAGDAAAAVDRLASGLDVEVGQVFPEPVPGSIRRCRVFVADEDPMLLPAHRSPLARLPQVTVWDSHPIAMTPVGRPVPARLVFSSFLIGAVPRSGKSYAGKVVVTPGVLDPCCDLTVLDCGGGKDWLATRQVAVDYVVGDEHEDLLRIVGILQRCQDDARATLAAFRSMSSIECPEDKLTRDMAERGLRPHLLIVDEIQNLLRCPDKTIRAKALELLVWLAKTAPKAGWIPVLITQRPAAEVIPADLRDIVSVRLALRTRTRQASDAILGSDISATGFRSDRFSEDHKGAAVIAGIPTGLGGDLQYARTDLIDPATFERACTIGRQRRVDAGTLRGAAAGDAPQVSITVTVLDDVAAVWPGQTAKVQARVLVERLRQVFADRYGPLTVEALGEALRPTGVPRIDQVWDKDTRSNSVGYALSEVTRARRALEAD